MKTEIQATNVNYISRTQQPTSSKRPRSHYKKPERNHYGSVTDAQYLETSSSVVYKNGNRTPDKVKFHINNPVFLQITKS